MYLGMPPSIYFFSIILIHITSYWTQFNSYRLLLQFFSRIFSIFQQFAIVKRNNTGLITRTIVNHIMSIQMVVALYAFRLLIIFYILELRHLYGNYWSIISANIFKDFQLIFFSRFDAIIFVVRMQFRKTYNSPVSLT